MIRLENIKKSFDKGRVKALTDISFEVNKGEIFGLLGPNGAGKTTTMRIMSTLLKADSGCVLLNGDDIFKNLSENRRKIGFLTNEMRLDGRLTPNESIEFYGKLYGLSKAELENNREKLFEYFEIKDFADRRYGSFSTGMKQKTALAVALIHNPDLIIFDEPTNGLDVLTQRVVENFLMSACQKEGKTIIISTHILDVIERLSSKIGVIVDGRTVFCGTTSSFCTYEKSDNLSDAFYNCYKNNHFSEKD